MNKLVNKWARVRGLGLEGVKDTTVKANLAQLFENASTPGAYLREDSNFSTGIGPGLSPTDSGIAIGSRPTGNIPAGGDNMGALAPMNFAVLRRSFPALFANKVIGVQAMKAPVSMIVALRYLYQGSQVEAGWDDIQKFAGFTGNMNAATGVDASAAEEGAAAQDPQLAEQWKLRAQLPTSNAIHSEFGTDDKYPELHFATARVPVIAKTRKLAASFSLEAAMDAKNVLSIDLEKSLLERIQYELVAEQDREILSQLKKVAQYEGDVPTGNIELDTGIDVEFLSAKNGGKAGLNLDLTAVPTEGRWQQEIISVLVTYIMGLANAVSVATHGKAGNFCIVSPGVATLLQAAGPIWNRTPVLTNTLVAVPEIGTIADSITVYRDQFATEDYVLVGYKGPSYDDAGIFYAPYVTGLESRAVSANNFSPRVGIMSRYALVNNILGAGRYYRYAKITIPGSVAGIFPAM